ncbi:hypothetical protein N7462_001321 [Penicillium macrosclerotiorum]|uniref:uncharacterized protein n=1 Tax=Penicillium macrosclerotiorum TaxID=303699 RepID=UPI002548BD4C|nr:uncharacterized protein N7462_001321 [Penicillium macrosclerotiorum]KAJ5691898.1 hypothetical protein N7462_001321 [Penicillium macrosclerotiorum]
MSNQDGKSEEAADAETRGLGEMPGGAVPNKKATTQQWKPATRTVEETLSEGLSNEDLWMLIRRFNKQIYHVKANQGAEAQDLDLNRAENEQFPPEKLRMTIERFYTSVIVGVVEFCRHIGRLRSWREPGRTSLFTLVYFVSWYLDLLVPTILNAVIALIMFPPIRPLLFPSAPKLPDSSLKPQNTEAAGQPGSQDSLTGVPESHKGETAEQEAKNLVDSMASIAIESAAAKYGQTIPEDSPELPLISEAGDHLAVPTDEGPALEDKTKKPVKSKVSQGTDSTMRLISDITDIYERFAKSVTGNRIQVVIEDMADQDSLLSPTPPFLLIGSRLRLSGILSIISLATPFMSSYWMIKSLGFIIGLGFFGGPLFAHTLHILNRKIPDWKEHMDIQKTLLKGVPTNAQLTLTLLRIGEINSSPIPPPPTSDDNEPSWPIRRKKSKTALSMSQSDQETIDLQSQPLDDPLPAKPKRRWVFKMLKYVRRTIATAIQGHIAFDRAMAIAGSAHTKNLISMLQKRHFLTTPFGPLKFDAKFERKRGAAVIDSSKEPPILYFTTYQSAGLDDLCIESRKKGSVLFQIPVTDIQELKKTEGLGWKGKLIVELTAGSKEAADGLVINGKELEQSFHLTGMRSRNQLFNRLIAIDAQFWESR